MNDSLVDRFMLETDPSDAAYWRGFRHGSIFDHPYDPPSSYNREDKEAYQRGFDDAVDKKIDKLLTA